MKYIRRHTSQDCSRSPPACAPRQVTCASKARYHQYCTSQGAATRPSNAAENIPTKDIFENMNSCASL
eukprot:6187114-Pleurochrysis_carterae.AAC.2